MRTRTAVVAAGAAVVAVALLAGCGGGGGDSALNPAGTTAASTSAVSTTVPTPASTGTPGARGITLAAAPWQLATAVCREVLVTDNKTIYLAGGLDTAGVSSGAVLSLEPATGKSAAVGTLALPVHDAMGVWRDGQIVVVAGGTPPIRTEVQSVTPGGAAKVIGQLPAPPRADHVVAQVNNTIYALGGGDEASNLVGTVVASTDGGATWRPAGSLVEPVRYPAVAVIDNVIYLFGGVSTTGGADTASVQRYDPKTEQTTVAAKLPATLSHATGMVLDNVVYLLGGYVNNRLGPQVWKFDPRALTTADAGVALPAPLSDSAAVVVDGVGYLVGGQGTDKKPVTTVTLVKPRA